jgi:hypothetical protein
MNSNLKVAGTTDEVNTCECCGRQDLKLAVALEGPDGAIHGYYGVVCAANLLRMDAKSVKNAAKAEDARKWEAAQKARTEAHEAEMMEWAGWLFAKTGKREIMRATMALGGWSAARELFAAR